MSALGMNSKTDRALERSVNEAAEAIEPIAIGAAETLTPYGDSKDLLQASSWLERGMVVGVAAAGPFGKLNKIRGIWTATKGRTSVENGFKHRKDHKGDSPNLKNAKQYVDAARKFTTSPPKGTLTKTRANGDKLFYDSKTNTFAVIDKNGTPRTMFKPDPAKHDYKTN